MFRPTSSPLRLCILAIGTLSVAATAAAQATTTKETVPGGPPKITKQQMKGEVISVGANWLFVRMTPTGDYRLFYVAPKKTATIDGTPRTVSQLQTGTMLTADVTITEYPLIKRTTTINSGKVFWASPNSVIITQENGENKQYAVPNGFKFDVDGKQVEAMQLKPGMMLKGTKIVEEPLVEITTDSVVTGTGPK